MDELEVLRAIYLLGSGKFLLHNPPFMWSIVAIVYSDLIFQMAVNSFLRGSTSALLDSNF